MQQFNRQSWFLLIVLAVSFAVMGYILFPRGSELPDEAAVSRLSLDEIPFDGAQAYEYLKQICALGPRVSGTPQMQEQRKLLIDHFEKLGGKTSLQEFRARHPRDGSTVEMANLLVEWRPDSLDRVLICTHYDTRPFPDRDRKNPQGVFLGANDGASGVAVLMQLAEDMQSYKGEFGVDFAFFDGEELVYRDATQTANGDPYFLGSEHFAMQYVNDAPKHKYRWGVLLDMVGDKDLQIYWELNSIAWPDTKPLVNDIWNTAKRLGVREFIARRGHSVRDDHLRLRNIAKIPTCDVIDFDYPHPRSTVFYWHTEADVPENCSALSLAKVGWVIREWMSNARIEKQQ